MPQQSIHSLIQVAMIPVEFQGGLSAPSVPAKLPRVIVWLRRDLRLDDNLALNAALEVAEEIVSNYHGSRSCLLKLLFLSSFPASPLLTSLRSHFPTYRYLSTFTHLKKKANSSLDGALAGGWILL